MRSRGYYRITILRPCFRAFSTYIDVRFTSHRDTNPASSSTESEASIKFADLMEELSKFSEADRDRLVKAGTDSIEGKK